MELAVITLGSGIAGRGGFARAFLVWISCAKHGLLLCHCVLISTLSLRWRHRHHVDKLPERRDCLDVHARYTFSQDRRRYRVGICECAF
jgi:hypothetical protein